MEIEQFKQMVARLEAESARAPRLYQAKVAALAVLGFGVLALLLSAAGIGLLLISVLIGLLAVKGTAMMILLLKLGKPLLLAAIPLWYVVKGAVRALFVRLPAPQGREITPAQAPALFAALDAMRSRMHGPRFHRVLVINDLNAAVVQRPAFGLIGWPRNHLLLGLPLLECLSPDEAMAVVAHEYGHLAGSHGHFAAFIYRLRHTWATVQAYTEHIQGWLGRLVAPLVRWYAPYFNAYTFVLARANEYQADAASAELVGAMQAARALKRVNLVGPRHRRFMEQAFQRIDHDADPPRDLLQRWAEQARQAPAADEAQRWLGEALDREGHFTDSHPTLRARLAALPGAGSGELAPHVLPPPPNESAAQAWLGALAERLRSEFDSQWAREVAQPWAERHADAQKKRQRLNELRAVDVRDASQQIEMLQLALRFEPETDLRDELAAFNAEHVDHALGLFVEGAARLDRGEHEGLALLDRAIELDPEATRPACERAHAFLMERRQPEAADAYARRWRERHDLETQRSAQLQHLDPQSTLAPHGLEAGTLQSLKSALAAMPREFIREVYVARRLIPADARSIQILMGVRLSGWGRRRARQQAVLERLAAHDWPVPLVFVVLAGDYEAMADKLRALPGARLL